MIEHCGTAAKAAQVTMELCGVNGPVDKSLEALALRKRAESKFDNGDFEEAEGLLCQVQFLLEVDKKILKFHVYLCLQQLIFPLSFIWFKCCYYN